MKKLIVIAGATAVGKTAFCVSLAQQLGTEIISADSRQFYQEMAIGTAKPTQAEMQGVVHHFIDSHSIHHPLSAGEYEKEALQTLNQVFEKKDVAILTGGSGLFIKALCEGFDEMPTIDPTVRDTLNQELITHGLEQLQKELQEKDAAYFNQVDIHNPQRVIRALEVIRSTGKTYSSFRNQASNTRPFEIIKVMLDRPREELYQRINERVLHMIEKGLVDEVQKLLAFQHLTPLQTVGYTEIFAYLNGEIDLQTAIAQIQQNTRRFAKRQLTWFRKDTEYSWFSASDTTTLLEFIAHKL